MLWIGPRLRVHLLKYDASFSFQSAILLSAFDREYLPCGITAIVPLTSLPFSSFDGLGPPRCNPCPLSSGCPKLAVECYICYLAPCSSPSRNRTLPYSASHSTCLKPEGDPTCSVNLHVVGICVIHPSMGPSFSLSSLRSAMRRIRTQIRL
jgi:hypothetical protein